MADTVKLWVCGVNGKGVVVSAVAAPRDTGIKHGKVAGNIVYVRADNQAEAKASAQEFYEKAKKE